MKVVILCGGKGTRLREKTERIPKPMVEIGGKPIVWHIMKNYAHHGFDEFVLCLGYKGDIIKDYFLNYEHMNNDVTVELGSGNVEIHDGHRDEAWEVTLAETGLEAKTGARVKRVEEYVDGDEFMLTYGDGVTNLNPNDVLDFHRSRPEIGTVTGVSPPSRYGELRIKDEKVVSFREKPDATDPTISGGYFVFDSTFFKYLRPETECVLEREPLEQLSEDDQLAVYTHEGFWQCMDTYRDYKYLTDLAEDGDPPWKTW